MIIEKKRIETKVCVLIFSTILSGTFLTLKVGTHLLLYRVL